MPRQTAPTTPLPGIPGHTVLITGASRGLGAALARTFAAQGARVSLCARRSDALEDLARELRERGAECLTRAVDVTDAAGVASWVEETQRRLGTPTVLVNNASVLGPRVPLSEYPLDDWRRAMEVNLNGAFSTIRAALPEMLRIGKGSIINVSSGAAVLPRTDWGAYSVSKYALEGLSRNLARELEGTGVRVNSVDPGAMRTQMRAAAYPSEDPQTVKTPEEATGVFLWLASDVSSKVSGERFRADDWRPEAASA